jgi:hypothetical protein
MKMSVENLDHPLKTPLNLRFCTGFFDRFWGLMFHKPLQEDEGIVLVQKRENRVDAAIHMLFMRTDLAVIWLDSDKKVVDKALAKRWRLSYIPQKPALYVLELSPSRFSAFDVGDTLAFKELSR